MAREVLSNGVINPDKYQADWYADLSNNWNLLNNLIGSAISGSEVDSKIATAIQELMVRTFQIVAELPVTGTEGVMYLVSIPDTSKYTAYVWENNAYRELGVIQMTITIDDELSTTSENPAQNKVITNALNNKAPISHTHSASDITSGLASVATSGSYNDLSNKPTIPSKTSDLTNDSGFITSDNTKIPLAGSNQISGSLIPSTDGTVNLGDSSYQWNNAYIKSLTINGVACGDILTHNVSEFVNVSSNQTIAGEKTFSNLRTYFGRDISCYSVRKYGKNLNPVSTSYQYIVFSGNIISDGPTNQWDAGYIEQVVNTNGGSRGRWFVQDTSENNVALEIWVSGNDKQVRPTQNSAVDLGTSTRKWKTINGINPGALSLPGTGVIDVSSNITVLDGTTANKFTPQINGWLLINGTGPANEGFIYVVQGRIGMMSANNTVMLRCAVLIPVVAGVEVTVTCKLNALTWANIAPCQGNV